ncbi:MAG: DUF1629 domain-containing protein [Bacteroidota bacterium]
MEFVYAQYRPSPHAGVLGPIQEVEDDYELTMGVPRLDDWPSDARFELDADFGIRLDDVMKCLGSLLVISDRLRAFLEAEAEHTANTEMLPVTILDHKGRPVDTPYVVAHHTHLQEALDVEASGATLNMIDPTRVLLVDQLVIRPEAIDPTVRMFRLARFASPVVFERGLAERIQAEGFTGIGFAELAEYDRTTIL